jgi:hypothetical protein
MRYTLEQTTSNMVLLKRSADENFDVNFATKEFPEGKKFTI